MRFIYSLLFTLYCLLNIAFNAYCADIPVEGVAQFEYNATNKRDPFMPLVTKDGRIVYTSGEIGSFEDARLEGIVYDPKGGSIAIINGLILKENDIIGNIKLIKIESNKVTLLFDQEEHAVYLKE